MLFLFCLSPFIAALHPLTESPWRGWESQPSCPAFWGKAWQRQDRFCNANSYHFDQTVAHEDGTRLSCKRCAVSRLYVKSALPEPRSGQQGFGGARCPFKAGRGRERRHNNGLTAVTGSDWGSEVAAGSGNMAAVAMAALGAVVAALGGAAVP